MIYYALVVMSMSGEVVWVDDRPMTFVECRHRRQNELTFYEMLRNEKVWVLCKKRVD